MILNQFKKFQYNRVFFAQKTGLGLAATSLILVFAMPLAQAASTTSVTVAQNQAAQQAASQGVPVSALNANAPSSYTVQRGDTLWAISGLYLNQPWRWPELWGMNLDAVKNPHLIYPGQVLHLGVRDGYARLSVDASSTGTIKLSPSVRSEPLAAAALPTIRRDLIEPFLVRPVIKDEAELERLPDILSSVDDRLIMGVGDKIYVRGTDQLPLSTRDGSPKQFSIFRQAKPLRDPETKEILGYEGEYVGQARIVRDEFFEEVPDRRGRTVEEYRPATLEITKSVSDVRVGDRLDLLTEDADYSSFVPRLPPPETTGRVISLYADVSVANATSGQVVAVNLGTDDGIEAGQVLQILKKGRLSRDRENGPNARIRLPDEPNGVLLMFRVFERVSYGLIMDNNDPVTVGDKLTSPE
ncbi:LysM peptidoglycan-binding domain-containing protein [Lampropedia puyangensis]|uniref:LysM peptidoglycan-binding domain-containing protein n=1 Tax=Lampropedia puyangensis TaxID=1330072 RepID=A0A4S8F5N1_9BURK|nr:LysM peptidoglycan-binding domain-containing protein [Lampropedia puyangensis]THU02753.1 LysM peptidoglycan-binding domain-containing protein [Lampropedia puyangensis]